MDGPVVKTPLGQIQGAVYTTSRGETIYTFLGVPYAKPPIDNLRFKNPTPVEAWAGIKPALKSPPTAPVAVPTENGDLVVSGSEDCLYVNIYTPEYPTPGKNLPVMAWIHGGGFVNGSGNMEWYGPDYLVPKGVILVSINYRLGALGFLSLQIEECPGNFGLKDQSLGLKWIQENIQAFGGNPKNVTVFGESAGGTSVGYHMLSPLSRGLFQKAIAQSGSSLNGWGFQRFPVEAAFILAKRLGYDGNDAHEAFETIRKSSTLDILAKTPGILGEIEGIWAGEQVLDLTFVPTAEPKGTLNAFLTKTPEEATEDGDFADVPYLTGVCAQEMLLGLPSADYVPDWNNDIEFQKMLPKGFAELGSEKMAAASKKLKEFYFPNGATQEGFVKTLTFTTFTRGVLKTVDAHSKNLNKKTPDFLYIFNASRSDSAVKRLLGLQNIPGVCHGDDLEFLFLIKEGISQNPEITAGTQHYEIKENVTDLWTSFAKTGNLSQDWPSANEGNGFSCVKITEDIVPVSNVFAEEIKFWDEIYAFLKG